MPEHAEFDAWLAEAERRKAQGHTLLASDIPDIGFRDETDKTYHTVTLGQVKAALVGRPDLEWLRTAGGRQEWFQGFKGTALTREQIRDMLALFDNPAHRLKSDCEVFQDDRGTWWLRYGSSPPYHIGDDDALEGWRRWVEDTTKCPVCGTRGVKYVHEDGDAYGRTELAPEGTVTLSCRCSVHRDEWLKAGGIIPPETGCEGDPAPGKRDNPADEPCIVILYTGYVEERSNGACLLATHTKPGQGTEEVLTIIAEALRTGLGQEYDRVYRTCGHNVPGDPRFCPECGKPRAARDARQDFFMAGIRSMTRGISDGTHDLWEALQEVNVEMASVAGLPNSRIITIEEYGESVLAQLAGLVPDTHPSWAWQDYVKDTAEPLPSDAPKPGWQEGPEYIRVLSGAEAVRRRPGFYGLTEEQAASMSDDELERLAHAKLVSAVEGQTVAAATAKMEEAGHPLGASRTRRTFLFDGTRRLGYRAYSSQLPDISAVFVVAEKPIVDVHSVGHGKVAEEEGATTVRGRLSVDWHKVEEDIREGQAPFDLTLYAYDPGSDRDRELHLFGCWFTSEAGGWAEFTAKTLVSWSSASS